ncbi:unnamed protein product [Cochlearia groenlandica]
MVLFLRGALIHQDLKGFNHSDLGHSFSPLDLCVYKQELRRKRLEISGSDLPRSSRAYALIPCWKSRLWRRRFGGRIVTPFAYNSHKISQPEFCTARKLRSTDFARPGNFVARILHELKSVFGTTFEVSSKCTIFAHFDNEHNICTDVRFGHPQHLDVVLTKLLNV